MFILSEEKARKLALLIEEAKGRRLQASKIDIRVERAARFRELKIYHSGVTIR
jgi:hypothetical protein